eukprot:4693397-Alexandrium_andersonii.AAC.1
MHMWCVCVREQRGFGHVWREITITRVLSVLALHAQRAALHVSAQRQPSKDSARWHHSEWTVSRCRTEPSEANCSSSSITARFSLVALEGRR